MNIDINVPCGISGNWRVEEFKVSDNERLSSFFSYGSRSVPEGTYKRLMRNSTVVMSNTPAEIRDHYQFISTAKRQGGNILINGLGLGVSLSEILKSDNVLSVTVIENSQDVINLVANSYIDKRVEIIKSDAFEWKPPINIRYSAVWHDIWDYICGDNLPEMTKLHRKYGRKTDWQGSWCKYECQAYSR